MSEQIPEQPAIEPEPVEEAWSGPSQSEWEDAQAQLQQYQQLQQQLQQQQPQEQYQQPQAPDPFSETFQQDLDAYIGHRLQGAQQLEQEIRLAQAEEHAMGRLNELAQQGGDFDRDAAYARANMILMQQGGDPMRALEQAAKDVREYEQRVGQAFYDRQIEQLQTNAGARTGLAASTIGAVQTIGTGGLGADPLAVTRKFFPDTR
jgi:hypothetical protein